MSLIVPWDGAASEEARDVTTPGLYLGSLREREEILAAFAACNVPLHVVCCTVGDAVRLPSANAAAGSRQLFIDVDDADDAPIEEAFERAIAFLEECRARREAALVHCVMGISRSPTIVTAYLMATCAHQRDQALGTVTCTVIEAMAHVASRRPVIHPNDGFLTKLLRFEARLRSPNEGAPSSLEGIRQVLAPDEAWMPPPVTLGVADYLASLPGAPDTDENGPSTIAGDVGPHEVGGAAAAALAAYIAAALECDPCVDTLPVDDGSAAGVFDWHQTLEDALAAHPPHDEVQPTGSS
jgi:predicted protein tyrosine phosphatase